ncbi:12531_t:CDS:1 [Funneliformis geosporum]|uniref:12956_t:CDS:1 n=1 Tax=Funneliformis geosporum TaxID=1117311 RepID=A0A9W4WWI6_9GLOM|nr:12531_t:CDS:1 [Funneliformis geosporum]CAI2177443.1 12956_t:CDS:1 [Funneliformis geosporum]
MAADSTSRACVFIDSSNPSVPGQLINSSTPMIYPPFPPRINPQDLVSSSKNNADNKKIPTRAPNAFIIYRKIFIQTARSQGYCLPMTVISSMASQSWEKENDIVKSEYKRLAKEAFNLRCEMLPKSFTSSRRRKREKWNIISFDDVNNVNGYVGKKRNSNIQKVNPEISPEINNDIPLKESNTAQRPSSSSKNHGERDSYAEPMSPSKISKIQLLLNEYNDDE